MKATSKRTGQGNPAPHHLDGFWPEEHPNTKAFLNALTALKCGDFRVRLPLDWTGAAGKAAEIFNELVASNERIGQELVQLRHAVADTKTLLHALTALKSGDFSVRLPLDWVGIAGKTADTLNEVVALNQRMASELVRLRDSVGREGRIHQRASLGQVGGTWAESAKLINDLIADLVQPTSEMARVIGAVAQGDLSQLMDLEIEGRSLQGEFLRTTRAEEDKARSRAAGFEVHLVKPVLPQQLRACIDQLLRQAGGAPGIGSGRDLATHV